MNLGFLSRNPISYGLSELTKSCLCLSRSLRLVCFFSGPQPTFGPIQTEDSDNQEMHRHPDRERVPRKKRRLQGHLPVCGLVMSSLPATLSTRLLVRGLGSKRPQNHTITIPALSIYPPALPPIMLLRKNNATVRAKFDN